LLSATINTDLYYIADNQGFIENSSDASFYIIASKSDYDSHSDLLNKICGACNLVIGEDLTLVLLTEGQQANMSVLVKNDKNSRILSIGCSADRIGLNASLRAYHVYRTETFNFLMSHSLRRLTENKEFKRSLWESVQQLFNVEK